MRKIIIGTRGSKLAMWQATYTQDRLKEIGIESELKIILTKGDKMQHLSFDKIEGKGFFTKELEDSLLNDEIDLAVHSMKDMPTSQPEGLCLAGVSYRDDPADCLIIRKEAVNPSDPLKLPKNPIIGTSSARRKSLVKMLRPDAQLKDVRGNLQSRLQKLEDGQFDAILLAMAGLKRSDIDLSRYEWIKLNPKEFVPAPAQGVLTWQTKTDNMEVRRILRKIHRPDILLCTNVERKVLRSLDGGCHLPLGVYCEADSMGYYHVWASYSGGVDKELTMVNLSSSTTKNLAERVFEKLMEAAQL